ncbi:hypothetical protein KGA66_06615 [Actinocrinis puniceicyclus]|uniref:Mannosyltransferase (PIG-V) n=1 Tax=Actinocrinis puniceicyclus TaxID=977794 RepID=A0A8J8BBQ5_9ACTN|nr:hypothetical protein [Actinocrinis puniceicyclus]MBS2962710.1 hypothetical protein [Actinocrinis puniceicyclus]
MPELAGGQQSADAAPPPQTHTYPHTHTNTHTNTDADAHTNADTHTSTSTHIVTHTDSDDAGEGERVPEARSSAEVPREGVVTGSWWWPAFRSALAAWLFAHIVIVTIQDLGQRATPYFSAQMPGRPPIHELFNQLYTWDTAWYLGIAQTGYSGVASDGVRFWPLLPLVTRGVSATGIPAAAAVLLVCWVGAVLFGMLMYRLMLTVGGDEVAARRAVWLSQLAPGAFVLAMGYTEALSGVLAAGFLIAIRQSAASRRAWAWHAVGFVCGLGSGLVRPTGLLLAAPGGIEVLRQRRDPAAQLLARVLIALSPLLGTGLFLLWSHTVYGNWTLPYSIQKLEGLRGTYAQNPLTSALDSLNQVGNGAGAFTVVLVVASLGLLWGCVRRLPFSFTVWAALSLLAAITAPHFSSFARYVSGILPLILVAAMLTRGRRQWGWVLGSCTALCAYFAYQSFIGIYVP